MENVDLNALDLASFATFPGLTPVAADGSGNTVFSGSLGQGNLVGWNPGSNGLAITDNSLQLVENSIHWAASGTPAVPEPGTYALFGLGIAGLLLVRRKVVATGTSKV